MQPGFLKPQLHADFKRRPVQSASALQAEAAEAAKRSKKRKIDARHPTEKASLLSIPESLAFTKLNEHQLVLDDLLRRRLSEAKEAIGSQDLRQKKRLRLYVFSSCPTPAQPKAGADGVVPPAIEPSWILYIYGRLMECEPPAVQIQVPGVIPLAPPAHLTKQPMTNFLRKVEVKLESGQLSGPSRVVWEKARSQTHREMLEVRGRGQVPCVASVSIEVDWQPERFTLAAGLSSLLGLQYETKIQILQLGSTAYWDCSTGPRLTFCRPGATPSPADVQLHDIDVEVPTFQPGDKISTDVDRISQDTEIEALDQQLSRLVKQLAEHKRRRTFYQGFAHAPVSFINSLIASQARDLRVAKTGRDLEAEPGSSRAEANSR
eukprot:gene14677-20714_t